MYITRDAMGYSKISIIALGLLLGHQIVHGYYDVISMVCKHSSHTEGTILIHCPEETNKPRNRENKYCCGAQNRRYCCNHADKLKEDPDFDPIGREDIIMRHNLPFWQVIILTFSLFILLGICFYTIGWSILQILYFIFCCPYCDKTRKQHYYEISIAEDTSLVRNPILFKGLPKGIVLSSNGHMGSKVVDAKPVNLLPENSYFLNPLAYNEL